VGADSGSARLFLAPFATPNEPKSPRGTERFEGASCATLFWTARNPLILKWPAVSERTEPNGEISEWLKEHASGSTLLARADAAPNPTYAPSDQQLPQHRCALPRLRSWRSSPGFREYLTPL
jgi:hypothetical protein